MKNGHYPWDRIVTIEIAASLYHASFDLYVRLKKWVLQELSIHISIYRRSIDACKSSVNTDKRLEFVDTEFKFVGNIYEQQKAR